VIVCRFNVLLKPSDTWWVVTDADCEYIEPQPVLIMRIATLEEYEAQGEQFVGHPSAGWHYYEASTD
jgi:hypothetical protein